MKYYQTVTIKVAVYDNYDNIEKESGIPLTIGTQNPGSLSKTGI